MEKEQFKVVDEGKKDILPAVQSNREIMMEAVRNKATPETLAMLKEMFEFDLKVKAQQAKEAYHEAMAQFKSNPPDIEKDKTVSYGAGKASYKHASLANVCSKINTALSAHGLSAAWKTDQPNGNITVTCTITHRLGHSESTSLSAPADSSGSKNPIQAIGSTISYLERYTILALTGLATSDMDDDATTPPKVELINKKQLKEIQEMVVESGVNITEVVGYYQISGLKELPKDEYPELKKLLQERIDKKNANN